MGHPAPSFGVTKARQLSADLPHQRVWLAIGTPSLDAPNILPLNEWPQETPITEILATPENRYRFLADRRDEHVFWLKADFVEGGFRHSYMVGGPGKVTDHGRRPESGAAFGAMVRAIGGRLTPISRPSMSMVGSLGWRARRFRFRPWLHREAPPRTLGVMRPTAIARAISQETPKVRPATSVSTVTR